MVFSPFKGKSDGTNTDGVKIAKKVYDYADSFLICFDASKVSGTQKYGYIGLKDSNGNGQQCEVKDTVPDFCGPDTTTTKRMSYPTKYPYTICLKRTTELFCKITNRNHYSLLCIFTNTASKNQ